MAAPIQFAYYPLNPENYHPDQQLASLGYYQRLSLEPANFNSIFSVFGAVHILHCLNRPQVAVNTANRAISEELKAFMGWIAGKQIDYAGITSPDCIQYYLGLYPKIEQEFGELASMEETTRRLSDYFGVHIVTVLHADNGEMKIQAYFTDGAAPILHLEAFPGMYYALLPGNTEGMPFEGTKTVIEQYYSLYLPTIQPPQEIPPSQNTTPMPTILDQVPRAYPTGQTAPQLGQSQPVPSTYSAEQTAPQLSQSQPLPDSAHISAMELIETQKKLIQSLALANSTIRLGPDTMQLLTEAEKLAVSLNMDGKEYQSIGAQLERSAEQAAGLPAENATGPVKTNPASTNPQDTKGPPAGPSGKPISNPAANPVSNPRPPNSSKPPGCQACGGPDLSMLYIDGNHRPCQICYTCCSKATHCPVCKREYTPAEKSRFQLITS